MTIDELDEALCLGETVIVDKAGPSDVRGELVEYEILGLVRRVGESQQQYFYALAEGAGS